jgi:hypothetical protein
MTHRTLAAFAALLALGAPLAAADDAHAGHNHQGGSEHAHGAMEPIGTVVIGTHSVAAEAAGEAHPGKVWHLELRLTPERLQPRAVRAWVGHENGRGSSKAKAEPRPGIPGAFSAHVEVPEPLPPGARLWIAIDPADAQPPAKGSLALPKE